jgi:biopolymer transport protein ExbD
MKWSTKTSKMPVEPPAVLLTDLAFNLVIFFVVLASTDPASGRKQDIPSGTKDKAAATQTDQNVEIVLTRTTVAVNGIVTPIADLAAKLTPMLAGKTKPEERMVVVKSDPDTPYSHWIRVTALVEQAGGLVALQLEESKEVVVP